MTHTNSRGEELIWVEKEFADKYNELVGDANKKEEQIKMFNEYMETVKAESKREFKNNFENLDEDVAIYKGLMLHVKQAFEKAKTEQLEASYGLWEEFDKEMPNVKEKTQKLIDMLDPLTKKLAEVDGFMNKIRTYDFEKLIEVIEKFAGLYGQNRHMLEFLIQNYKAK